MLRAMFVLLLTSMCVARAATEVVVYGGASARENNLAGPLYSSHEGSSTTVRAILGDLGHVDRPRPYLIGVMSASSRDVPEENTFTYGAGVELRPLAYSNRVAGKSGLDWLSRVRVYIEEDGQLPLRSAKPAWSPRHDLVAGFDVWREYGAADAGRKWMGDRYWGELYLGAAFHTTDFYQERYNSLRIGMNAKAGPSLGSEQRPIRPYVVVDVNTTTGHPYSWQNRLVGGMGMRVDLRPIDCHRLFAFIQYDNVLSYVKDSPATTDHVPRHDLSMGITYSHPYRQ